MAGRTGRSGGIKFTPVIREQIFKALVAGNNRGMAAAYAGIRPETLSRWLSRPESAYVNFAQEVAKAEAMAEIRAVAVIREASRTDWRAAAWLLERRYSLHWGKRTTIHLRDLDDQQLLDVIAMSMSE